MTNRFHNKASALVTTLFVLVVLSTIVVAFLASMNLERKISSSMQNKYQAELAAEAGLEEAIARMYETTRTGPYAAIYLPTNDNPYLFLAKREFSSNGTITRRIPLFSTRETNFALLTNFSASFLANGTITLSEIDFSGSNISRQLTAPNDRFCEINATNSTFPFGMVGLRSGVATTNHPKLPVNWIYMTNSLGKVIGRYAYWTDDECSKLDLRFAGNLNNVSGTGNHTRSNGSSFSELSLLPLTNLPGVTNTALSNALAFQNSANQRLPYSTRELRYVLPNGGPALPTNVAEAIRPYVTVFSKHDDRSLDGKRRINLNELVASPADINAQTLAIRAAITNNLPEFGKRFYSSSNNSTTTPTEAHQKAYATRIAANIRDFIDTDPAASMILANDTAHLGNSAAFMPYDPTLQVDTDLPLAFGKDSKGLQLSEYMRVVRVISQNGVANHPTNSDPTSVRFRFGHYVELVNTSGRTINTDDLGEDAHILLAGRQSFLNLSPPAGTSDRLRFSDLKMRLPSSVNIPPGGIIYITTDGTNNVVGGGFPRNSQVGLLGNSTTNRYQLTYGTNSGQWSLINTNPLDNQIVAGSDLEDYLVTTTYATNEFRYGVRLGEKATGVTYTDQRERLILANSSGIIDCALRISTVQVLRLAGGDRNPAWINTYHADPESSTDNNTLTGLSSQPRYSRGDLRSNFDIVSFTPTTTAHAWKASESKYGDDLPGTRPTLGTANSGYSDMTNYISDLTWRRGLYEITSDAAGNAFYKNTNITSLAELGYVYDPVRHDIAGYRSMGATLRIGQSDSPTNNRATNSGVDYQNWLGGRGSDNPTNAAFGRNAFLLMDIFRTDTNTSGRINPNSVVRDRSGVVMRAALGNFTFETQATNGASTLLAGQALNETNTFAAIQSFATNSSNGFLVSVGDLSRVPAFWSTNTNASALVPGVRMSSASDSGKEELLRRTANLFTTQSLAYSVFVVGQAGSIERRGGADVFVPTSTVSTENVIQMEPIYAITPPETPLEPSGWRLRKPRSISY